jgi:tetratricopeptide (TPR) repeat protein
MNQDQLLNYIQSPDQLDQESMIALSEFAEKYPYCQTTQLLLAKNRSVQNHVQSGQQLKLAAAYASDREKLYYLMNKKNGVVPGLDELITPVYNLEEFLTPTEEKKEEEKPVVHPIADLYKPTEAPVIAGNDIPDNPEEKKKRLLASVTQRLADAGKIPVTDVSSPSKDELVERFIRTQPRINVKKILEENQEDLSRKAVTDRDDFISETLARIYARQGDYEKAVKIYEKLSLKNPEKSSYFAAQIEKVKNKII